MDGSLLAFLYAWISYATNNIYNIEPSSLSLFIPKDKLECCSAVAKSCVLSLWCKSRLFDVKLQGALQWARCSHMSQELQHMISLNLWWHCKVKLRSWGTFSGKVIEIIKVTNTHSTTCKAHNCWLVELATLSFSNWLGWGAGLSSYWAAVTEKVRAVTCKSFVSGTCACIHYDVSLFVRMCVCVSSKCSVL